MSNPNGGGEKVVKESLTQVAYSLDDISVSVKDLTATLHRARNDTKDEIAGVRRVQQLILLGLTILFVASIAVGYTLFLVHDATDPDGSVAKRGQKQIAAVIQQVAIEQDCRQRRALAHLAAPDPRQSCTAQTPPEVYPGG